MRLHAPLLLAALAMTACHNHECKNTNPVFDKNTPASEPYKAELAKQLVQPHENLIYHLESFHETDSIPYMIVSVEGNDICAEAVVLIDKTDDDIAAIVEKKGVSYEGAELIGLEVAVVQNPGDTDFFYRGMDYVLD